MPGNICHGDATVQPKLRESKAYCEGRTHAYAGGLIGDNPHPANTDDNAAWAAGFNSYAAGVGSPLPRDCCAEPALDGVP